MKVLVLEAQGLFLFLVLWCIFFFFWVHNLNHKDDNFGCWEVSRVLENLGMPSTSSKAGPKGPVWASRVFTVGNWRTKSGDSPRKEGSLGFLRIILKMVPNLILVFLAWTQFLAHIRCCLASPSPLMSFPAWHQGYGENITGPSLKPPVIFKAWPESLLFFAAFSNYFSHYWVFFHSDCLQHLESFSI